MLHLIARAIFGPATATADDPWTPIVEAAIEKAVDASDARLRALRGYQRKLREPVTRAAHFAHELGERLPPAIEASRGAFSHDPSLQAFLSSADRLQEVFSTSLDVQRFVQTPGSRDSGWVHAALAMDLSERVVLAQVLRDGKAQRDVERTLVSFDAHRVVMPSVSEAALRRQFKERAFTTLVECALERMVARRERKSDLEKQRALLRAKLRAVKASRSGLDSLAAPARKPSDPAALERALEETEKELGQRAASGDALERNLQDLCATLGHPDEYVDLQVDSRRLTRMNYAATPDDEGPVDDVEFARVYVKGESRACGTLARYPISELKPSGFYSDRMRRALGTGP